MKQLVKLTICLLLLPLTAEQSAAQKPELVVQTGHSSAIGSVEFSPDGKLLATGGRDGAIKLWEVATGTELRTLKAGFGNVQRVLFSPDGKTLAGVGMGIKLWDVASGRELHELGEWRVRNNAQVLFSPDGKTLAGFDHTTVSLWDATTGKELHTLHHPSRGPGQRGNFADSTSEIDWVLKLSQRVYQPGGSVRFGSDGNTLVVVWPPDKDIRTYSVADGKELLTLTRGSVEFQRSEVSFSPDGKVLAFGNGDAIYLSDVTSGARLHTLKAHHSEFLGTVHQFLGIIFSPDGKTVAGVSGDRSGYGSSVDSNIELWDVMTGAELHTLKGPSGSFVDVDFSPNGKTLAAVGDKATKLWDVLTGRELHIPKAPKKHSVVFSPDGSTLAADMGEAFVLWDVAARSELRNLKARKLSWVVFSPDGNTLAGAGSGSPVLWDVSTGAELGTRGGHSDPVEAVSFSPDGKILASGNHEDIRLWDVKTGAGLRTLKGNGTSIVFTPNGNVSSGAAWRIFRSLKPDLNTSSYSSLALSRDGKKLAAGVAISQWESGTIELWDVSTGAKLGTLKPNLEKEHFSGKVQSLAFSLDGKILAAGFGDATIRLWDVATGAELGSIKGLTRDVYSVAFSSDGSMLAGGDWAGTVKVWDVTRREHLFTLNGHADSVKSVAYSPDGRYLVSGSSDGTVRVWGAGSGEELATLIALGERDWIVVTPDGLFDGSPPAWGRMMWRFHSNTFDHAPVEAYFNEFYYPGLLSDIFAGKQPKAPSDISEKDRQQPQLRLALADARADAMPSASNVGRREGARNVAIKIEIAELAADKDGKTGSGAQDVRLFRNGSLVKVWRGDVLKGKSSVTLEATVPIIAGENKFTAYGFNHDNIKSSDAELIVSGADSLKRQGTAYIVAIGVNTYSNTQYNLNYAVADAEEFAAEVKRQQESLRRVRRAKFPRQSLKSYAKVEVISLTNGQATKAGIKQKLSDLADRAEPEDAVIVFFAGHGTAQGNQFYLLPHDLGYSGPRENLDEAGLKAILAHSISDRELEKLFEGIDAGQLLLVIDACNSGQALEAEEKRRGPMNSKGLAQLAYEKGMYVMTAAQSYQAALEAEIFGHGYLTYALIEKGLKKGSADHEPKNGAIDIREWLNFATDEVPRMQEQNSLDALRGRGKRIIFVGDGRAVGIPKTEADARDNIQRPRVFYRRELEVNPLIVATVTGQSPR